MKRALLSICCLFAVSASAAIQSKSVEYKDGDTVLEGWVTYDDAITQPTPGVLIVHQWKGLGDYEKKRAEMLARMGVVAFCADIYGKGIRADSAAEAGKLAGKYKGDRALLRQRVNAALKELQAQPHVNQAKVAAIGYCFGGTTVLELARSGADVAGVVSFHGGLSTPTPADAKNIKTRVLALHGADDPFVPAAEVADFQKEMRDAGVDWQMVSYGGAVHSFTDWNATGEMKGAKYDKNADTRSWANMQAFFREIFR
jgi:dienelactone hydrolase